MPRGSTPHISQLILKQESDTSLRGIQIFLSNGHKSAMFKGHNQQTPTRILKIHHQKCEGGKQCEIKRVAFKIYREENGF